MRKTLGARRRLVVLGLAVAVAAAMATGAWAPINFGNPPSTFRLEINGVAVQATSYSIDGTSVKGPRNKQDYTVRITAPVTGDTTLLQAFQDGQVPGDVVITLYDAEANEVAAYDFANATAVSYQQTGDRTASTFQQDLVFTSSSLTLP